MKTLTILFESPNVFYAVIDGVNIRIDKHPFILVCCADGRKSIRVHCYNDERFIDVLDGDIFQVDGFEYEVKIKCRQWIDNYGLCDDQCYFVGSGLKPCADKKVAILKLAKEEEQEPDIQTSDIHHTFKPHGQFKVKEEEPKEHCMYKS